MLDYIQDGRYGMLWLRSREMDRRCQIIPIKRSRVLSEMDEIKETMFLPRQRPGKMGSCGAASRR